ncbi:DNA pilot protein [Sigmofec virus UA08Rod_5307]|uniref:DNA pilot protein n=1 Tax=Sigmofec virus UA08Rod_5307 TaxID=2929418 RepID=A0A976R7E0_9VIRU|nr:DNA pilot protein [Sigmofec virus UA08Rod_5307]
MIQNSGYAMPINQSPAVGAVGTTVGTTANSTPVADFLKNFLGNIAGAGTNLGSSSSSSSSQEGFPEILKNALGMFGSTWLGELLGLNYAADELDFKRSEHSSDLQLARDLRKLSEQNAFNSAEAEKNRAWQKEMSDTAYQRAIADMKKAGLNPVLAYQQGGASTPSGASASSGSGSSSSGHRFQRSSHNGSNIVGTLLQMSGGLVQTAGKLVTTLV